MLRVDTINVGEKYKQVGSYGTCYERGEHVVFPKDTFCVRIQGVSREMVLVDDGNNAQSRKVIERVAESLVPLGISEIFVSNQFLCCGDSQLSEFDVIKRCECALAGGCTNRDHLGRDAKAPRSDADGAGGDEENPASAQSQRADRFDEFL